MKNNFLEEFDCSTGITNELYVKGDLLVRTSRKADSSYVDNLQKKNSAAVGFIQKTVWDKYVYGGERNFVVFICEKNNDMVGYVLLTPGKKVGSYAKIQQIAIQEDARRLEYGTALIETVRKFCNKFGRMGVTLRCRKDLQSNFFWQALGFNLYGIWEKGKKNHVNFTASNDIMLWKIELNEKINSLFSPQQFNYSNEIVMPEFGERHLFNKI